jgi:mono/diheme cytochrome c family protein
MSYEAFDAYIGKIHQIRYFMPPFAGSDKERGSLAAYLTKGLQGREIVREKPSAAGGAQGKGLFLKNCTLCHPESLIKEKTYGWDLEKIRHALDNLNALQPAMPDFKGPPAEKDLMAGYIYLLNNPRAVETEKEESDDGRGAR